jgi:hypothetical protein
MVCDPTTYTLIQTLENVQRRAARFVIKVCGSFWGVEKNSKWWPLPW